MLWNFYDPFARLLQNFSGNMTLIKGTLLANDIRTVKCFLADKVKTLN